MPRFERESSPDARREECVRDVDFGPATLADEKWYDPNSVGTASDDAGVTSEIHRAKYRRRRGPNQVEGAGQ